VGQLKERLGVSSPQSRCVAGHDCYETNENYENYEKRESNEIYPPKGLLGSQHHTTSFPCSECAALFSSLFLVLLSLTSPVVHPWMSPAPYFGVTTTKEHFKAFVCPGGLSTRCDPCTIVCYSYVFIEKICLVLGFAFEHLEPALGASPPVQPRADGSCGTHAAAACATPLVFCSLV
jgi:hypothetical protein